MTPEQKDAFLFDLHKTCGLAHSGKDDEGQDIWIGTDKEWKNYTEQEERFLTGDHDL